MTGPRPPRKKVAKAPQTRAERAIAFIETYCRVPEGNRVGQPMVLEPFQRRFIAEILDNPATTKRAILSMARKNGKGLALDTPVPTPTGWTTMGALRPGDAVFDERGEPCTVQFVSPVHVGLKCWRLTFSDGSSIVADEQHRWLTTHQWRPWARFSRPHRPSPEVVTTPQIAESVRVPRADGGVEYNHGIAVAGALQTPEVELPMDPYLLGCWLGDGSSGAALLTCGDEDIVHFKQAVGDVIGGTPVVRRSRTAFALGLTTGVGGPRYTKVNNVLRRLGLLHNKHIPAAYLWAGTEQRRALLQGLMDTDGTVTPTGVSGAVACSFSNINERLARETLQLVRSLGLKATLRRRDAKLNGRVIGDAFNVQFTAWADDCVFRLERKAARLSPKPAKPTRSATLKIESCEPVASVPTVCIQVDSPSRLFLAGEGMTTTHNTALIAALVLVFVVGPEARRNSQIVSGAMSKDQAAIVFNLASKMVSLSEELSRFVKIIPSGKKLIGLPLNVQYQALAADGTTAQGLSPRVVVLDEVGQVRGPRSDFIDALLTAQGAYDDGLVFAISTQSPNDADLFSVWIDDALKGTDPAVICHLYAAPADCPLDDHGAWRLANPALGKFRSLADLEQQSVMAMRMPSSEAAFRNLCLNQRVETQTPFVTRSVWESNGGYHDEAVIEREPLYLGIDLSARADLTAIVAAAKDEEGIWHIRTDAFTPEDGLIDRAKRDRVPYDLWVKQGWLHTTPGASVDPDYVAEWLLKTYGNADVQAVAYDRWRIDTLILALKRHEASDEFIGRLTPFGQGTKDMSPALDALEAELLNGRVRHGGHPVLTMCAHNTRVWRDSSGNRKFEKQKSSGRIDAMVALAMAVGVAVSKTVESSETFFEVW